MSKSILHWLDPILVIGLSISVAIGILMVLSGNDSALGLAVGLLSTIVTLLIDIIARIRKAEGLFTEGLTEVERTLQATGALKPLLSREALYQEVVQLIRQCGGTEIIRATSLLRREGVRPTEVVSAAYVEALAAKVSQSKKGKLGMIYRTVVTKGLSNEHFDAVIQSRYQPFEKHKILDRIEMHASEDLWSMDIIIIGTQHMVIAFPAQGRSYSSNLGMRISDSQLVENVARWYDECLWIPTPRVTLPDQWGA